MSDESSADKKDDETPKAEAPNDEAPKDEAQNDEAQSDEDEGRSVLDTLDLARGEVSDEDLDALEDAINTLDFATRKASEKRQTRLDGLALRLSELADQIKKGVRPMPEAPVPLTDEQQAHYDKLIEQGMKAGKEGDLGGAVEAFEEAVRTHPEGVDGLFNLGVVYGLLAHKNIATMEFYDDYVRDEVYVEKAQICYDAVLEVEEDHLPSLHNLATLAALRDDRESATSYLERILGQEPTSDGERRIVSEARAQLRELQGI